MFKRIFVPQSVKEMQAKLKPSCPEPARWETICAYLVQGKRPKDPGARQAIRSYLDLREHLRAQGLVNGSPEFKYAKVAKSTETFFAGYDHRKHLSPATAQAWACFCLAADMLLAKAAEAGAKNGQPVPKGGQRAQEMLTELQASYLEPLCQQWAQGGAGLKS